MNFRIFIDAATLKRNLRRRVPLRALNFRIFIDAATLKQTTEDRADDLQDAEFPHLYRCGHIEALNGLAARQYILGISASL